jgi:hypothetical protein
MPIPNTYTNRNETGCCAAPNIEFWDEKEITFENKRFIRMYTRSFFYMPLNMSKVMTKLQKVARDANASMPPQDAMTLSRDISPWRAEQLYAVTKELPSADNVLLLGTFFSKVFEGPYKNTEQWHSIMQSYATRQSDKSNKTYFFYTTCPKCAKHYGKNYVIGLVEIV